MPDDRFFHKRAGHSDKVNTLSDFEELIWRYYVLSADDFGVMKFDHHAIQNDHERAGARSAKLVQRALDRVRDAGLIHLFDHQGRSYCYSRNWQKYQKVDYPRETMLPCPSADELALCDADTADLFGLHPGGKYGREIKRLRGERVPNESRMYSDSVGEDLRLARAGALAEAKANGKGSEGGVGETDLPKRAGAFCQWYEDTHRRIFSIGYMGTGSDYQKAIELCGKFSDAELHDGALVWFGMDDDFAKKGTRSIPKFASRITGCLQTARAKGIA